MDYRLKHCITVKFPIFDKCAMVTELHTEVLMCKGTRYM